MSKEEILAEIKRVTDLREKDLHEYRRIRAEAEKLLYRTLLADSQLMDLQYQVLEDEDLTEIGFIMLKAVNRAECKAMREQAKWQERRKEIEKERKNGKNR